MTTKRTKANTSAATKSGAKKSASASKKGAAPKATSAREPKTKATASSVSGFLAKVDAARRGDAEKLCAWMSEWTGSEPVLWGSNIVGFGTYSYSNGRGGSNDWPIVGFSPRATNLTVYLMDGFEGRDALLRRLGPHKLGKACLYLKGLAGLDDGALKELVQSSVAAMRARHPTARV
ncbi:MAG: DUF1801 domain-containing protein [Myxococcales bacterium]|nr:DUF1801 domain-containing protein [Myxococcales bacterium]